MGRIKKAVRNFFLPPPDTRLWRRLLPYGTATVAFFAVFLSGAYVWDYTNSPQFCGTTCHTMPPEYAAYLTSPHARILCVECHIGRDFIGSRVLRKAGDLRHVIATAFQTYDFPIYANDMRPARETCEQCHSPEKFSDDSLREIKHYGNDTSNTPTSIFLTLKTGGGSRRQGLGRGIHWHIESKIYYLPTDVTEQTIPYVRVINDEGTATEYVDIESKIDPAQIDSSQLKEMDCITCHNRITHLILPPEDTVDQLLTRKVISLSIPEIRRKAVQVLDTHYDSTQQALETIAGLAGYYERQHPDYFYGHTAEISATIEALQDAYANSVFPEQKADWMTHANNIGHKNSPGCFRCHDGKHLDSQQQAIRLECNLCHSIPVVVGPDQFVANIEISRGPEPQSHLNPNWLALHHDAFDDPICSTCHTTGNPGGTDNSSFCSNSGCHGTTWQYAGLDAPGLSDILKTQLPPPPPPPDLNGPLTYADTIGPVFREHCSACHGPDGLQGLNLTTYTTTMAGSRNGRVIIPGDPDASLLVQKQSSSEPHFAQLSPEELNVVVRWITAGAPEK